MVAWSQEHKSREQCQGHLFSSAVQITDRRNPFCQRYSSSQLKFHPHFHIFKFHPHFHIFLTKDNNSPLLPQSSAGYATASQQEGYSLPVPPTGHLGRKKRLERLCQRPLPHQPPAKAQQATLANGSMKENPGPQQHLKNDWRTAAGLRLRDQHGHFSNPSRKAEAKDSGRCLRQAWHGRIVSSQHKALISRELFSFHWFIHSWEVEEDTQPSLQQKHRESTTNKWSILCIPCTCILHSQQYYFLAFSRIKPPRFFFFLFFFWEFLFFNILWSYSFSYLHMHRYY